MKYINLHYMYIKNNLILICTCDAQNILAPWCVLCPYSLVLDKPLDQMSPLNLLVLKHSDTGLIFTSCKLYYERPVSVLREYPILVFIFMNWQAILKKILSKMKILIFVIKENSRSLIFFNVIWHPLKRQLCTEFSFVNCIYK